MGNIKTTPETIWNQGRSREGIRSPFLWRLLFWGFSSCISAETSGHVMSAGKIGVHHGTVWILALFHLQNLQIKKNTWKNLGGIPTPLKNMSQIGSSSQLLGKIKHVPNHQPVREHLRSSWTDFLDTKIAHLALRRVVPGAWPGSFLWRYLEPEPAKLVTFSVEFESDFKYKIFQAI